MININSKSWHYYLYELSHMPWRFDKWARENYSHKIESSDYNLCDYVKRIFLLLPFKILFKVGVISALTALLMLMSTTLALPFINEGLWFGLFFYGMIIGTIVCLAIFAWFQTDIWPNIQDKCASSKELVGHYYSAIKGKYCPKIHFVRPQKKLPEDVPVSK